MSAAVSDALRIMQTGIAAALRIAAAGHDADVQEGVETIVRAIEAAVRAVEQEDGSR